MSLSSRRELKQRLREELRGQLPHHDLARAIAWGGILIVIGAVWLTHGGAPQAAASLWRTLVPALIAWNGLVRAAIMRTPLAVLSGVQQVAIAGWLYAVFNEMWGWTFQNSWPVVLIAVGVGIVLRAVFLPGLSFGAWACREREESSR